MPMSGSHAAWIWSPSRSDATSISACLPSSILVTPSKNACHSFLSSLRVVMANLLCDAGVEDGAPRSTWPSRNAHHHDALGVRASYLAAAPEPTFVDGIPRPLAFAEELDVSHDWLVRMVRLAMRDIRVVVRNADHQARRSCGPIGGGGRCSR